MELWSSANYENTLTLILVWCRAPYEMIGARRLSEERGSPHSGHGPLAGTPSARRGVVG